MNKLSRIFVAATLSLLSLGAIAVQAQEDVKIAYVDPFSGAYATLGDLASKQFFFAADRINAAGGVLGGRNLKLTQFDNHGSAADTLVILQDLIDQGYQYVFQSTSSPIALALSEAVAKHNERNPDQAIVLMNYGSADRALTNDACNFWFFRFGPNSDQYMAAVAKDITANEDVKSIYLLNQDYSFGHAISGTAKELIGASRPDIQFVGDEFIPVSTTVDFSPYILKIRASGADTVLTSNWGTDLTYLVKAAADAGLDAKFYTLYAGSYGTPTAIGDAGDGKIYEASPYHPSLAVEYGNADLESVYTEFKKQTGSDYYLVTAFYMFEMLAQAINDAGTTDPLQVANALEDMTYKSWLGDLHMRADDHQIELPMFVSKFTKGVKYDVEGTGLGWVTSTALTPADTVMPTSCEMKRPS